MEKYFSINKSGCSIRCKLYYNNLKSVSRVVVCGHGFGGSKDNRAAEKFADHVLKKFKDIALITYDEPCHGDDVKKKLSLDDCGAYISLVTEHARSRFGVEKVYGYATSFGGYQFLKYISENENPFFKIALRCPAVNMYDVLSQCIMEPADLKMLANGKPVAVGFDTKIKVNKQFLDELKKADITKRDYKPFSDSIFIMHGTKDSVVSFDTVKRFAQDNSIKFTAVENADHLFIDPKKMDEAIKNIIEFFEW